MFYNPSCFTKIPNRWVSSHTLLGFYLRLPLHWGVWSSEALPSAFCAPTAIVLGGSRSPLQTHSLEMPAQHCAPAFPIGVYCFLDNFQMLSFQMRFRLFLVAPSVRESVTHFFPCHNPSSLEFVIVCWFGKTDPGMCDHQTLHECPQSKRLCQKKIADGIPLPTEEKCWCGAQTHY